ncbi:MAG: hypothetical protein HYY06_01310 [Deltaproteobacteria bacterium]|nr:hypothetical protein [Deltaproteobacteria bacterium]
MRSWVLLSLLAVACTKEGGPTASLLLRFEADETFNATDRIEITVYEPPDGADHCPEVLGGQSAVLAGMDVVAGPVSAPRNQISSLGLEGVSWGKRLFYATAHTGDDEQIAHGCTTMDVLPSGASVTIVMERVPCDGEGSFPCGPDAVCRGGQCEDRACRMDGSVTLADFTYVYGVGAQQVVATDDGILVAWSGSVGVRRGVAVALLAEDLGPLGDTLIVDGDPCTWPALAPTSDGFILAWADYGPLEGDQRAIVRTRALDKGGNPTGAGDEVTLRFPGDYANEDVGFWNAPGLFRLLPTSLGAVAIWYENAEDRADPSTGPWQVSVVAMDEQGTFTEEPHALDYPSAFHYETSRGTGDGAAIELIVAQTGECRLATIAPDGRVISDEALTGPLESCATVTFGPTEGGYTFLAQESRRLTPWPSGESSDSLFQSPDEPLAGAVWGTFAQAGDGLYLGWEEHAADLLTSRINVAVLDRQGNPTGPAVPFAELTGNGPYYGFSMTATSEALYATWLEGVDGGNRIAVARIVCD